MQPPPTSQAAGRVKIIPRIPLPRDAGKSKNSDTELGPRRDPVSPSALLSLVALIVTATLLQIIPAGPLSAHEGKHNATRKKQVSAYGAKAYIEGTDPAINNGQWSYHRVALVHSDPWMYGEIGWLKIGTSFTGHIVLENPSRHTRIFSYTPGGAHSFAVQWDPNQEKHHWFYDGDWLLADDLGFDQGDFVMCGGEVATGVEGMGDTRCGNGGSDGLGCAAMRPRAMTTGPCGCWPTRRWSWGWWSRCPTRRCVCG